MKRSNDRKEKKRGRRRPDWICSVCDKKVPFCWSCTCGFMICQDCMDENAWGMTCNNLTWECPDCGTIRTF